jgi:hypothetical protein
LVRRFSSSGMLFCNVGRVVCNDSKDIVQSTSGSSRGIKICALLGYYEASCANFSDVSGQRVGKQLPHDAA